MRLGISEPCDLLTFNIVNLNTAQHPECTLPLLSSLSSKTQDHFPTFHLNSRVFSSTLPAPTPRKLTSGK